MTSNQCLVMLAVLSVCFYMVLAEARAQDSDLEAIKQSSLKFACKLYDEVSKKKGNLLFSPMSIHSVLTLTSLGARAETARQMTKALSLPSRDVTTRGYDKLLELLNNSTGVNLLIVANKIYPCKSVKVVPEFLQKSLDIFGSEIQQLDFLKANESANTINNWVESKTHQEIRNIVDAGDLDGDTLMVLVSAVCFHGAWLNPYVKLGRKDFHETTRQTTTIPMMSIVGEFGYKDNGVARVLELPFKGNDFCLFVILPSGSLKLKSVEEEIKKGGLDELLQGLKNDREVDIMLPIFRMERETKLQEVLEKMGMPIIFKKTANFKDMISSETAYVDSVLHKSHIYVNENGTEFHAGKAVGGGDHMMPPSRVKFHVQRPFIYALRHGPSGQVLFLGRCVHPAESHRHLG